MKEIAESDQVAFFWSLLNEEWQEESSVALLHMVVSQFLKIRGFSYASSWIENFKATHKKTTQKSKGIRKQLISESSSSEKKTVSPQSS